MNWSAFRMWLAALPKEARGAILTGLLLAAVALVFLVINIWSSASESWYEIVKSEPRIARLKGYQAFQPAMVEAASEAEVVLQDLAFTVGADESETGARLQQLLRGFAEDAGLTVRGSQLITKGQQEKAPEGFIRLSVELRVRGLPVALNLFLRDVYEHSPRLKVAEMNVVKVRERRASRREAQSNLSEGQELEVSIQVAALMVST